MLHSLTKNTQEIHYHERNMDSYWPYSKYSGPDRSTHSFDHSTLLYLELLACHQKLQHRRYNTNNAATVTLQHRQYNTDTTTPTNDYAPTPITPQHQFVPHWWFPHPTFIYNFSGLWLGDYLDLTCCLIVCVQVCADPPSTGPGKCGLGSVNIGIEDAVRTCDWRLEWSSILDRWPDPSFIVDVYSEFLGKFLFFYDTTVSLQHRHYNSGTTTPTLQHRRCNSDTTEYTPLQHRHCNTDTTTPTIQHRHYNTDDTTPTKKHTRYNTNKRLRWYRHNVSVSN